MTNSAQWGRVGEKKLLKYKVPYWQSFSVASGEKKTFHITSSIIGIFKLKFYRLLDQDKVYLDPEHDVEVVIGRSKVDIS